MPCYFISKWVLMLCYMFEHFPNVRLWPFWGGKSYYSTFIAKEKLTNEFMNKFNWNHQNCRKKSEKCCLWDAFRFNSIRWNCKKNELIQILVENKWTSYFNLSNKNHWTAVNAGILFLWKTNTASTESNYFCSRNFIPQFNVLSFFAHN